MNNGQFAQEITCNLKHVYVILREDYEFVTVCSSEEKAQAIENDLNSKEDGYYYTWQKIEVG